ncbi:MAG: nucleotide exchange factor GrpE [Bacteroidales bacterium]|nr:nucleotide exchange factor GrpE [Bacteroidales bacterium]
MIKHNKEKQDLNKEKDSQKADEKSQSNHTTDKASNDAENKLAEEEDKTESDAETDEQVEDQPVDEKELLINTLQMKNNELNDKYLRLFSEFDNFRKRTIREKQELTKTASAGIIEAILPVVDDLNRAYKSAIENPDLETLTEGLNLIRTKLNSTLKHKGLEEIPCLGEEFNTDFHEAITHIPAENEKDKGKVIDEVQKGYILNGKVLRFAKVVVAN